ncbi:MAG: hypothetical protein EBZ40_09575, partial [Gammaproteobacteria bacterium]|nr:hypothetical protein [Gammaproteobacteria bacterium]
MAGDRSIKLLTAVALAALAIPAQAQHADAEAAAMVPPAVAAERCPPETAAESRRRSADVPVLEYEPTPCNPAQLPTPMLDQIGGFQGLPDRWRLVEAIGIKQNLLDPYHGYNILKGDKPAFGEDWFFALVGVSDTVIEPREFPVPVGGPVADRAGSLDLFGDGKQNVFSQTFAVETILYKGNTVFKPPEWEFRFTPAFNVSRVSVGEQGLLKANPDYGRTRTESVLGIQALFVDKHMWNVSERYDFDSVRVGVQPFTADFRGFLYSDSALGVRWFGIRDNNRLQYNLAWFRRIDKDTNSGLNNLAERGLAALRHDDLFVANVYYQDFPVLGFTSQAVVMHDRNREGGRIRYDENGIIQRPASLGLERSYDYDVTYLGVSGDGHFGVLNLSTSAYAVVGDTSRGIFVERSQNVRAGFFAAELSRDFSWIRARGSIAWASGDRDPYDGRAEGFDAVLENPLFAGADTSFWIREPVPLIAGGRVALSGRNGMLNSLRSSKEFGQSNFVNPGLRLLGAGVDLDLTPTLRVSGNLNYLAFDHTATLEAARAQSGIGRGIGIDASVALTWRPLAIQNVVARLSYATLFPGAGYRAL